jgi:acetyl esterase/lipase
MKTKLSLIIVLIFTVCALMAQEFEQPIYTGVIPNSKTTGTKEKIKKENGITLISNVQDPSISVFLPSKRFATGQAIVICPGGGYWVEAYDLEGTDIAKHLNSIGVAAVVLKYRLPTSGNTIAPNEAPLMDAQRAMRMVRANARNWNIEPDKIGVMGFSAGGHLASTLGTHFDNGNITSKDSIEQQSCRPNFMVLMYPVISFIDSCTHAGSRFALLGKNQSDELKKYYSNELHVTKDTPPTFIALADDDKTVPAENALLFYKSLRKNNIKAELHIISEGEHGFGLNSNNEHVASWTYNLKLWLNSINYKK